MAKMDIIIIEFGRCLLFYKQGQENGENAEGSLGPYSVSSALQGTYVYYI